MIDYTLILTREYLGFEWNLNGDDYDGLVWLSDEPKPSKKTLDDLWGKVQTEIAAETEARATAKADLLDRLGITALEVKLLLS